MPQANASESPAEEPAHDVLAAEAFAVPAADPELSHRPVVLPEDPSGIEGPHDILAAEEFAIPVGRSHGGRLGSSAASRRRVGVGAVAALVGLLTLRRRRRR